MTTPATPAPLEYARPITGEVCPNCGIRPATAKLLYGHAVCKKCLYGFANRRQIAWFVDGLLFGIVGGGIAFAIGYAMETAMPGFLTAGALLAFEFAFGLLLSVAFILKDGVNGQSPGKMLTGVQVVDARTNDPISFGASLRRNAWYFANVIPVVGGVVNLVLVIIIIVQMTKGPRLGDRYANTRVIWNKFATSPVFGGPDTRCRGCNYDLTGNVSGQCPECGRAVPAQMPLAMPA